MGRRSKLVAGRSTSLPPLSLIGALAIAGCGEEREVEATADAPAAAIDDAAIDDAAGESPSGVEPAGEPEAVVRSGDPSDDDAEYLYRLGVARGHLAAFIELYRAGAIDMAETHLEDPQQKFYDALVPALAARGQRGFIGALNDLADAADGGGDVEAKYATAISAIRASAPASDVQTTLLSVSLLVAAAAKEFDIGVSEDGVVTGHREYQDAYGFLAAAREMLAEIKTYDINASEAIAVAHEQIDLCLASFNGLVADQTEGAPATLHAAAARIEGVALRL